MAGNKCWDCREGAHDYDDPNGDGNADCPAGGFTDPVLEYFQQAGRCSVTGGYRYRGAAEPRLAGVYLYADFCTGEIFGTVPRCDGAWESRVLLDAPFKVTAFGEGEDGEVYVTEFDAAASKVHLLTLATGSGGPDLAVSPAGVDFGEVSAGDTVSTFLTLENDNAGPEALRLASVVRSDTRFRLDYTAGASPCRGPTRCLAPGQSCQVGVSFRSTTTGVVEASLALDGNFTGELMPLAADVSPCATSQNLTLSGETFTGGSSAQACDTLTVGPDVTVTGSGDLRLCGGTRVVIEDGLNVEAGGTLRVGNALDCPVA